MFSFFKAQPDNPAKILFDIIRLIKDAAIVANDFLHLKLLDAFIELIKAVVEEKPNTQQCALN